MIPQEVAGHAATALPGKVHSAQLLPGLDELVVRSTRHLRKWLVSKAFRCAVETALMGLLLMSFLLLLAQIGARFIDDQVWSPGLWHSIVAMVLPPILYFSGRMALTYFSGSVERPVALALYDRQLGLKDRLVTADQFLQLDDRDAFTQAAIDDAVPFIDKAMAIDLDPVALLRPRVRNAYWLYLPAALTVLLLSFWVGSLPNSVGGSGDQLAALEAGVAPTETAANVSDALLVAATPPRPDRSPRDTEVPAQQSSELPSGVPGTSGAAGDSNTELRPGPRSESGSSGSTGSAAGRASSQASPNEENQKSPASEKENSTINKDSPDLAGSDQDENSPGVASAMPGDSAADQSDIAAAASDSDADDDNDRERGEASPGNNTGDENERSDDRNSDSESESDGDSQPDNRRRGDGRSNTSLTSQPEAVSLSGDPESSGGSRAQKKSRGVMSMILGVPLPDKIAGTPDAGQVKILQEETELKEENPTAVAAQDRRNRAAPIGHLEHPSLSLSMQDLVQNYFLSIRKQSTETEEGN